MKWGFLFFTMMISKSLFAQTSNSFVPDIYHLRGVMEVGSGFSIKPDHTFEFFFAYGALDRAGKGTWQQHGDSIILNSAKKTQQDFKLVQVKNSGNTKLTIVVKDNNPVMVQNIYASVQCPDTTYRDVSDNKGTFVSINVKQQGYLLFMNFFLNVFLYLM